MTYARSSGDCVGCFAAMTMGAAPEYPEELAVSERAALLATWLQAGRAMRTAEVAQLLGVSPHGARKLLTRLSGVLPIVQDGHVWRWVR